MAKTDKERRNLGRKDLSTFFPTVFTHQGKECRALLVNLSDTGGRFQPQQIPDSVHIQVGDTLALEIRTDKGILNVQSRVSWVRKKEAYTSWGAQFLDLDATKSRVILGLLQENP